MTIASKQLAIEAKRMSESCLYTSTTMFIWLRILRAIKVVSVVLPLALGSIAGWSLLTTSELPEAKVALAVVSFLAGLFPTIFSALKLDSSIVRAQELASEFKILQHRFRQSASVMVHRSFEDFKNDYEPLMNRFEKASKPSYTAPEFCFWLAQRKVQSGDYEFDLDLNSGDGTVQ